MNTKPHLENQIGILSKRLAARGGLKEKEQLGYEAYKPGDHVLYRLIIQLPEGGIHPVDSLFRPYGQFISYIQGMLYALDLTYKEVD